ncbi:putative 5-pentadecatrienyl resorcinol O-methyltransferase [Iris pallida]|uniref:5-pentadecatrienyl resorcinol O-methyltransferase n=1 Tax=Iris pallida TaxID=29817 RepID=A0AAX6G640_IRIPA|nr:putative 5-pentadecatrienyl resorcinol O-methyltransferase [Iris pallida]
MASNTPDSASEVFQFQALMVETIPKFHKLMAIKCAMELGIPRAINRWQGKPISLHQLMSELELPSARAPYLARLMRLLTHMGCFANKPVQEEEEEEEEGYVLTPSALCLCEDLASHIMDFALNQALLEPWFHMSSWFRGHAPTAFHAAHGMGIWEFAGRNPEFNDTFNKIMSNESRRTVDEMVEKHGAVFDGVGSLVDAGGGDGTVARDIVRAFPHVKCSVFDLPHVVAAVDQQQSDVPVGYIPGNMFESIPSADAVLLKKILHDYEDGDCIKILKLCKEAISNKEGGGKVIILDVVVNKKDTFVKTDFHLLLDVQMMALVAGKEREEHEWQKIFNEAGFTSYKITPLTDLSLIELKI